MSNLQFIWDYVNWGNVKLVLALFAEVSFLTCAYWIILRIFRHTQALYTILTIFFFWLLADLLNGFLAVPVFTGLANILLHYLPLALLVLYHDEIRRFLAHPMIWIRRFTLEISIRRGKKGLALALKNGADELVKAVCCMTTDPKWRAFLREYYHIDTEKEHLLNVNTGALIVIEGVTGLEEVSLKGVKLDCLLNYQLLRTIFYEGSALHDGGVILRLSKSGVHIIAAGCDFPSLAKEGGPNHARTNAAHGMALAHADSFVLMISEERGSVLQPDKEDPRRMHRFDSPLELREALIGFWQVSAEELEIYALRDKEALAQKTQGMLKEEEANKSTEEPSFVVDVEGKEEK